MAHGDFPKPAIQTLGNVILSYVGSVDSSCDSPAALGKKEVLSVGRKTTPVRHVLMFEPCDVVRLVLWERRGSKGAFFRWIVRFRELSTLKR